MLKEIRPSLLLLYIIILFCEVSTAGEDCKTSLTITAFSSITDSKTIHIEPGTTSKLVINCSFNVNTINNMTRLNVIDILHSFDGKDYSIVNFLFRGDEVVEPESDNNLTSFGSNEFGEFYLSREYPDPGHDKAGFYMCRVNVDDFNMNSREAKVCSSSQRVLVNECIKSFTITTQPTEEESSSTQIELGLTEALRINCTIDLRSLAEMFILYSLTVLHSFDTKHYQEVFTLEYVKGRVDDDLSSPNGGLIKQFNESYVRLEIANPDLTKVGTYICEAKGMTRRGDPYTCFATKEISVLHKNKTCETTFKIKAELQKVQENLIHNIYRNYTVATKHLLVKCSVKVVETMDLDRLTTLTLLQSPVKYSNYRPVASINKTSGPFNISASGIIVGEGVISKIRESYLSVQWKYPNFEVADSYMCEAHGVSYTGQPQSCFVSVSPNISPSEWQKGECFPSFHVDALAGTSNSTAQKSNSLITHIVLGITKKLQINCSIDIEKTPALDFLHNLMLLYAGVNSPQFMNVASLLYRGVRKGGGKRLSVFNRTGKSYLYVEWDNFTTNMAGTYRCEAQGGYAQTGRKTCWASRQVKMLTFRNLFVKSDLYRGRRYYFYNRAASISYELAQATCSKYGGYLAEINNAHELGFVNMFLNDKTGNGTRLQGFLISGNDEMEKGKFIYSRNNQTVQYLFWARWEPSGEDDENCLFLGKQRKEGYTWSLYDSKCFWENPDKKYSFLCEIEQN